MINTGNKYGSDLIWVLKSVDARLSIIDQWERLAVKPISRTCDITGWFEEWKSRWTENLERIDAGMWWWQAKAGLHRAGNWNPPFRSLELYPYLFLLSHRSILDLLLSGFPNIHNNDPQCLHIQRGWYWEMCGRTRWTRSLFGWFCLLYALLISYVRNVLSQPTM